MKSKQIGCKFIVRIDKGEEVMTVLKYFCEKNSINLGTVSGIGGASKVEIDFFDISINKYVTKVFDQGPYEIVSILGNITLFKSKPLLHLHITIADKEYKTYSGHLKSAIVGITGEIFIQELKTDTSIERKLNEEFGLNLIDL